MNDRAISLLEQYDIEVLRTRKGRGTFICDTKQGTVLMKEYTGHPEKLTFQQQILRQVKDTGLVRTEELLLNKENQLYVKDNDGVLYIVKTCFEGSECNIYDGRECVEAMRVLAKLHESMDRARDAMWEERLSAVQGDTLHGEQIASAVQADTLHGEQSSSAVQAASVQDVGQTDKMTASTWENTAAGIPLAVSSPLKEYEKHNRELIRIWSYLKKKGQKQIFEIRLLGVMEYFVNQAKKVTESWREIEASAAEDADAISIQFMAMTAGEEIPGKVETIPMKAVGGLKGNDIPPFCHGDYQYHNIIRTQEGWCVLNFEKMLMDNPVRDVYLFMRKVMEKNNWPVSLGKEMMAAYEVIRVLEKRDRQDLYHRFAYPEKFWKIANFYYNSGKAWIPEKNLEKLEKVIIQEKEKQVFLREIFKESIQA